jgi:hypothetical protein
MWGSNASCAYGSAGNVNAIINFFSFIYLTNVGLKGLGINYSFVKTLQFPKNRKDGFFSFELDEVRSNFIFQSAFNQPLFSQRKDSLLDNRIKKADGYIFPNPAHEKTVVSLLHFATGKILITVLDEQG